MANNRLKHPRKIPVLAGRTWNEVRPELQAFLRSLAWSNAAAAVKDKIVVTGAGTEEDDEETDPVVVTKAFYGN